MHSLVWLLGLGFRVGGVCRVGALSGSWGTPTGPTNPQAAEGDREIRACAVEKGSHSRGFTSSVVPPPINCSVLGAEISCGARVGRGGGTLALSRC